MPNELLVSRLGDQTWAALRSDGRPVELHVVSPAHPDPLERIVRGRVVDVRPGIRAAFVDIGLERPAFLRAADPLDPLEVGRELTVQVVRGPLEEKGAKVSRRIGLPGRYLVCRPGEPALKLSGSIGEEAERRRLHGLLERCPTGVGWIARSRAVRVPGEAVLAEAALLLERWRRIEGRAGTTSAPGVLEPEPDLFARLLRDLALERMARIVVDHDEDRARLLDLPGNVEMHCGPPPLVLAYDLIFEAGRALERKVGLPSGGHLVFEQTSALLAIDVNTASGTALDVNLEAVAEVARQLRLRDLGGSVVIDLIAMDSERDRSRVRDELAARLREDRARTRLVGFSDRRLLHLVRRRRGPGLEARLRGGLLAAARELSARQSG